MANKINKSVRLDENLLDFVEESYSQGFTENFTEKLENRLQDFQDMIEHTKRELENVLDVEEAVLIMQCFNNTTYDSSKMTAKKMLLWQVEDGIKYDGYDVMYSVNADWIQEKIKNLTEFQSYVVIQMAMEYLHDSSKISGDSEWAKLKKVFQIK